jgi:hypothetical protein
MTPLRTPQRTPGGKGDAIMMEAEVKASGAVLMIFLALITVSHSGKVYSLDSS